MANREIVIRRRTYGRPRRVQLPEDLPTDWEDLFEEWGKAGLSITEVRAQLDMSATTWGLWFRQWPEFREVVERFLDLTESWWLNFGRQNLGNKFFNGGLYMTQMALRFKYPRQLEHQLEQRGNAQDTLNNEREEDMRLADLFSGGDGNAGATQAKAKKPEVHVDVQDAEWLDRTDLRTKPK